MPRIHLVSNLPGAGALGDHLRGAGLGPTSARAADALLVLIDRQLDQVEQDLLDRARQSVPVLLAGPTLGALPADSPLVEATGLVPDRTTPVHELRIVPGPNGGEVSARMAQTRFVDSWVVSDKVTDDVQQLLMVRYELGEQPVCTWRPSTGLGILTLGSTEQTLADPEFHRLVGRWLRHALSVSDAPTVQVGILGSTENTAVHAGAIGLTDGLELASVCDSMSATPHPDMPQDGRVRRVATPAELIGDPDLGLVIVSTRSHTRAEWATRALEAGKNVVIDQPFALSTHDADELAALATSRNLTVVTFPDGRYDSDHRALQAALTDGAVGDVFGIDMFVGGREHPGGSWHDDARASGGQAFDRGVVPVGWILDVLDQPVEWVSATTQKRVWHDVTNADHTRVLIHFEGGAEAQVVISDLAAIAPPALHLLGTTGAIIGARGLPGAPLDLTLVTADGASTRLAFPQALDAPFHRDLADHLLSGWPAPVTLAAARRVVAVLEAAVRSAEADGALTPPD